MSGLFIPTKRVEIRFSYNWNQNYDKLLRRINSHISGFILFPPNEWELDTTVVGIKIMDIVHVCACVCMCVCARVGVLTSMVILEICYN